MSGHLQLPLTTPAATLLCPASLPLEELLRQVGAGDQGAFAEVYDATASRAFGLALSVTRDRSIAGDVVQEAFSNIWRSATGFDPNRGSGMAWVLAIVHAKAVARVRSTSTRLNDEPHTPVPEAAALGLAIPQGHRVGFALSQIPAAERRALELAYFGGYTHAVIARITGVPADTAKSRIREGLTELRRGMQAAS